MTKIRVIGIINGDHYFSIKIIMKKRAFESLEKNEVNDFSNTSNFNGDGKLNKYEIKAIKLFRWELHALDSIIKTKIISDYKNSYIRNLNNNSNIWNDLRMIAGNYIIAINLIKQLISKWHLPETFNKTINGKIEVKDTAQSFIEAINGCKDHTAKCLYIIKTLLSITKNSFTGNKWTMTTVDNTANYFDPNEPRHTIDIISLTKFIQEKLGIINDGIPGNQTWTNILNYLWIQINPIQLNENNNQKLDPNIEVDEDPERLIEHIASKYYMVDSISREDITSVVYGMKNAWIPLNKKTVGLRFALWSQEWWLVFDTKKTRKQIIEKSDKLWVLQQLLDYLIAKDPSIGELFAKKKEQMRKLVWKDGASEYDLMLRAKSIANEIWTGANLTPLWKSLKESLDNEYKDDSPWYRPDIKVWKRMAQLAPWAGNIALDYILDDIPWNGRFEKFMNKLLSSPKTFWWLQIDPDTIFFNIKKSWNIIPWSPEAKLLSDPNDGVYSYNKTAFVAALHRKSYSDRNRNNSNLDIESTPFQTVITPTEAEYLQNKYFFWNLISPYLENGELDDTKIDLIAWEWNTGIRSSTYAAIQNALNNRLGTSLTLDGDLVNFSNWENPINLQNSDELIFSWETAQTIEKYVTRFSWWRVYYQWVSGTRNIVKTFLWNAYNTDRKVFREDPLYKEIMNNQITMIKPIFNKDQEKWGRNYGPKVAKEYRRITSDYYSSWVYAKSQERVKMRRNTKELPALPSNHEYISKSDLRKLMRKPNLSQAELETTYVMIWAKQPRINNRKKDTIVIHWVASEWDDSDVTLYNCLNKNADTAYGVFKNGLKARAFRPQDGYGWVSKFGVQFNSEWYPSNPINQNCIGIEVSWLRKGNDSEEPNSIQVQQVAILVKQIKNEIPWIEHTITSFQAVSRNGVALNNEVHTDTHSRDKNKLAQMWVELNYNSWVNEIPLMYSSKWREVTNNRSVA